MDQDLGPSLAERYSVYHICACCAIEFVRSPFGARTYLRWGSMKIAVARFADHRQARHLRGARANDVGADAESKVKKVKEFNLYERNSRLAPRSVEPTILACTLPQW
jgi:hypothetical protein